jgi:maltose alpha-D-glucosyltransferase / alpha-amylase
MRKLLVNPWALLAILCLTIEVAGPLYAEGPPGPKWLETAVFYQVYPQSFFDSNGDGIGDLPGITAKLDYIKSVGCNAIWINPIYESPFSDAGYDVADFYKVAARYGTNEDLKNLCAEAHKRRMHVCLDLVAGHTSIAHPWFQQSALGQPNRYSNWYIWTPAGESVSGSQPFPGEHNRSDRFLPNFFPFQPALNYGYARPDPKEPWQLPATDPVCIAVREELKSIVKFWLELGADGFRVDMAASLIRNDADHLGISALWRYYRSWLDKEYPEAVLVSEWSNPAVAIPAGFHIDFMIQIGEAAYGILLGPYSWPTGYAREPHAFFERAGGGDIKAFIDNYLRNYNVTKSRGYIAMPTANHDIPRPTCGRDELEVRAIFAMLLTMPGVPFIYYGDEIGMDYIYPTPNKEGGTIGALQRCGSRTPMQWSKEKNAGFSTAPADRLYLPIDPSPSRPDVATEEKDPASMLNFTRALLKLRRDHPALANTADFQPVYAEKNRYPFVYLRTCAAEQIIVSVNPADRSCSVAINGLNEATPLLVQGAVLQGGRLEMEPVSFGIFAVHVKEVSPGLTALKADASRDFGRGATVRFAGDGTRWTREIAEEWAKKTGNTLEYIFRPADTTATLQRYQQYWAAKSGDVDVYAIAVTWQGIAAPHAVDLKKYFKEDQTKEFFSRGIENNTIEGHLVSIPWFTDVGLLYYRTDLLEKYGYKAPPRTWEELTEMAKRIQEGERTNGKPDFQGFVFEGKASESLTCNALEWIYSYGGGSVIDPDKKVTINNPNAIKALETAETWVGIISPTGVTTYGEEDTRSLWQVGNAAFMRNWAYAYSLGADPTSPISGKFDVTVLPKGGADGRHAACLGGWGLMVSAYSQSPDAAADLLRYLTSSEIQKKHAIDLGLLPTLPALYNDPDVLQKNAWFKSVLNILPSAIARPSRVTGADYNQVSMALFQNVNKVLGGDESAKDAVSQIERVAKSIVP